MKKLTPDPPEADNDSSHEAGSSAFGPDLTIARLNAAIAPHTPSKMFLIAPDIDTETLLAHACESLASASVMTADFAGLLDGTHRNTLLGIQQVIMLGELAVNRALDNIDPHD